MQMSKSAKILVCDRAIGKVIDIFLTTFLASYFYQTSRDYVSEEKQNDFMKPEEVANIILSNLLTTNHLTVADIVIERNT